MSEVFCCCSVSFLLSFFPPRTIGYRRVRAKSAVWWRMPQCYPRWLGCQQQNHLPGVQKVRKPSALQWNPPHCSSLGLETVGFNKIGKQCCSCEDAHRVSFLGTIWLWGATQLFASVGWMSLPRWAVLWATHGEVCGWKLPLHRRRDNTLWVRFLLNPFFFPQDMTEEKLRSLLENTITEHSHRCLHNPEFTVTSGMEEEASLLMTCLVSQMSDSCLDPPLSYMDRSHKSTDPRGLYYCLSTHLFGSGFSFDHQ